uniref:Uncharacterized protein n=1 Tax=Anopheles coluzzii TaxID=1518534 RepID=A0A8W7PUN9_ANOCL
MGKVGKNPQVDSDLIPEISEKTPEASSRNAKVMSSRQYVPGQLIVVLQCPPTPQLETTSLTNSFGRDLMNRYDGHTRLLANDATLQRQRTDPHAGQARAVIVVRAHRHRVHRKGRQVGQDGRRLVGRHLQRHQAAALRGRRIRQIVLIERVQPRCIDLVVLHTPAQPLRRLPADLQRPLGQRFHRHGLRFRRQALPGSVCCTQETRDLSRSVNGVYSPRHMSWHRSGMPFSTQHGTWLRPSAMHRTMFGKSRSHCSGSAPADPSRMLCSTQKPMHASDTLFAWQQSVKSCVTSGTPSGLTSSSESVYTSDEESSSSSASEVAPAPSGDAVDGDDVVLGESVAFRLVVAVFFFGCRTAERERGDGD